MFVHGRNAKAPLWNVELGTGHKASGPRIADKTFPSGFVWVRESRETKSPKGAHLGIVQIGTGFSVLRPVFPY